MFFCLNYEKVLYVIENNIDYKGNEKMEQHLGKYTLLERLGGGGMAEVFRACLKGPEGFEKQLALKLILSCYSEEPEFVQMFIQEANLAANLDHANIVRIYEFDQIDGRYYIAMELVSGKDLRKIMVQSNQIKRPISIPEILVMALEASKGLAFAHGEIAPNSPKIVHRDISPHNIIISQAGEVKITDFGIAKLASSGTVTKTGFVKGKAAYMAPEQAKGSGVDQRSDIFSLGCVIWELLAGRRLFSGENEFAIVESLMRDTIEPPSNYNPQVFGDLDDVVLEMLQRDPEKRSKSASTLSRRFDHLLQGFPSVNRLTILVDLYRDLFSEHRVGTTVLPVKNEPAATRLAETSDDIFNLIKRNNARKKIRLGVITSVVVVSIAVFLVFGLKWMGGIDIKIGNGSDPLPTPVHTPVITPAIQVTPAVDIVKDPVTTPSPIQTPDKQPEKKPKNYKKRTKRDDRKSGSISKRKKIAKNTRRRSGKKTYHKPRKPKVENGFLDLNAIPWARVFWRNRLLGPTPLQNVEFPPGEHTLILENQDLGIREKVPIRIDSKRKTKRLVNLLNK